MTPNTHILCRDGRRHNHWNGPYLRQAFKKSLLSRQEVSLRTKKEIWLLIYLWYFPENIKKTSPNFSHFNLRCISKDKTPNIQYRALTLANDSPKKHRLL